MLSVSNVFCLTRKKTSYVKGVAVVAVWLQLSTSKKPVIPKELQWLQWLQLSPTPSFLVVLKQLLLDGVADFVDLSV